jgi:catechol 2,3-dioxygenase-like lactoylglutathione lyase family enzyme
MSRIAVKGIDHVVVTCSDVERSLAWYRDKLGLEPLRADAFRRGEVPFVSMRISDVALIDLIPGERSGVNIDHFSLWVDADLEAVTASGDFDVVSPPKTIFGSQGDGPGMYVRDPDGNVIELKAYPAAGGAGTG